MSSLTFAQRIFIALTTLICTGLATTPLMFWTWMGTTLAIGIRVAVAWGLYLWLCRFIAEQHGHYLAALRGMQTTLQTGQRGPTLKNRRLPDSFGTLANEINSVGEHAAKQVSQQLARNEELEQNKTLFQSILATMIEGVLVLDSERRILFFNDAARSVLNCTDRNVEGRPVWEVLRATDLQEAIDAVFESGEDFRKEIELRRSRRMVEITAVRLPLQPSPGVVVVLHEVTELRGLERMRRDFVSNVSHELKTPLSSIQAYADTLLDGGLADEEHNRRFVERILEQSDRLQTLIQDMLRLARIESQSEAFQLRSVSLSKTLETCVDSRLAVARTKQVDLSLEAGGPQLDVFADPSGLQTIFDNLISNALNYAREPGWVRVRWFVDGKQVVVEVADNGIGIGDEHRERIFERFYRVDRARSPGGGGNGLGLAIVKHLTLVFGGTIEVESEPGQGSTFRIRLPFIEQSSDSLPPVDADASSPGE